MSGTAAQIEWFIARDGARHGPISDVEMRKFVELGHLKPTDLVWCPQFTEWQLASVVFPPAVVPPPPPLAPAPQPAATGGPAQSHDRSAQTPARVAEAPMATAGAPAATHAGSAEGDRQPRAPTQPSGVTGRGAQQQAAAQSASEQVNGGADDAAWAHAMRSVLQQSGPLSGAGQRQQGGHPTGSQPDVMVGGTAAFGASNAPPTQPTMSQPAFQTPHPHVHTNAIAGDLQGGAAFDPMIASGRSGPSFQAPRTDLQAAGPGSGGAHGSAGFGGHAGHAHLDRDPVDAAAYDDEHYEPPRRKRGGRLGIAAAVLLIVGGLAWLGWQNRSMIAGASAIGSAITSTVSSTVSSTISTAPSGDALRLSPYDAPGTTPDAIDASLQKTAIWRVLKRDFPEWYAERLTDVARMREEKRDEKVISRFLADVIITLRRRHAISALQSSPEHLKGMARRFGENLKQLSSRDGATCFQFITFGEANPEALELSRTPAFAETLQRQMIAIFEAIRDAKASAKVHAATRRADYDLLTKDLMARGWTATDLATFSDPQKLTASPPEKVCTLVQEWFQTHLALTDGELQSRLLAESLKPLVGG